jgi:predicted NBD/HSP70 family sugar kinase
MQVRNGHPGPLLGSTLQVLAHLRDGTVLTLTELSEALSLSRPTVAGAVQQLEELGWVKPVEPATTSGRMGRPAVRYGFDHRAGHVLGLDIGAHTVRAGVADLSGDLLSVEERVVSEDLDVDARLAEAQTAARAALASTGATRDSLIAARAGTVGIIDDHGTVTLSSVIPGWTGIDLAKRLHQTLKCPVRVETDARLAALAEHWRGAAIGADRLVYVHAGHRVGSGILIDGQIYRGAGGASGEIGALEVLGWSRARASLEELAAKSGQTTELALAAGDHAAQRALASFVDNIVPGIAALVLVLDPDKVVLGGGLAGMGKQLSELVLEGLEPLCLRLPEVQTSSMGVEGVLVGAVRDALDWADRHVFGLQAT